MVLRRYSTNSNLNAGDSSDAYQANIQSNPHLLGTVVTGVGSTANSISNDMNQNDKNLAFSNIFFEIPRSTRKRILRFLCDNGWIEFS